MVFLLMFYVITEAVGRPSNKIPVSSETNGKFIKCPIEIAAEDNSTNGKSTSSLTAGKGVTRRGIERRDEIVVNGDNRSRQFQPPDQVGSGKHQSSPGSDRSQCESRDSKRQKKSNPAEAFVSECCFCHSSDVNDVSPEFESSNFFYMGFLMMLFTENLF